MSASTVADEIDKLRAEIDRLRALIEAQSRMIDHLQFINQPPVQVVLTTWTTYGSVHSGDIWRLQQEVGAIRAALTIAENNLRNARNAPGYATVYR